MDEEARPVRRMVELQPRTREFLSKLDDEDIDNLEHAIKMYTMIRTIGIVGKWTAITILAIVVGIVSLYENIVKMIAWAHR